MVKIWKSTPSSSNNIINEININKNRKWKEEIEIE